MAKSKYTYKDSRFFRLRSKKKLAELLFVTQQKLQNTANMEDRYFEFQKPKKNGEMRNISAPVKPLKEIQSRISDLLKRIAAPEYLFAPVQGRSYADNAVCHLGAKAVHLLDIDDFFPNCTINKAIWFFRTKMECSPDVSAILARIVTNDGSLPQGSPCSPILAYLCYMDMWDEISELVKQYNCKLSVYADDLTISGDKVPGKLAWEIKKLLVKHGHQFAKNKEKAIFNKPVEITGVIIGPKGATVPNRQFKKIVETRYALLRTKHIPTKVALEHQLHGRLAQAKQIQDAEAKQKN